MNKWIRGHKGMGRILKVWNSYGETIGKQSRLPGNYRGYREVIAVV